MLVVYFTNQTHKMLAKLSKEKLANDAKQMP